ncbi:hypothetical protein CLV71_11185 [Actinophytocola oryzae]|uniref:Guanylate cyclase domain-containing protein n=2 Tax=Actinophytocola oryzae TaxID=502181 RepID=A0A4R7VB07_9PSEU|nr:hypothetical protein CLV71_11185 [Actinophytocola oryzae]
MSGAWGPPEVAEHRRANRLGFVVDVVSYGQRTVSDQERISRRLEALLRAVVADVGDDFDEVDRDSGSGDGLVVFLPTASDPVERLPALLRSVAARLAEDNRAAADRIRLRMTVGAGPVARGGPVFAGPLVVNISRLVDSEALRRAVADNPDADLVVLVLDVPRTDVVAPGYTPLAADRVGLVDVAMNEFVDRAWLWVSTPG